MNEKIKPTAGEAAKRLEKITCEINRLMLETYWLAEDDIENEDDYIEARKSMEIAWHGINNAFFINIEIMEKKAQLKMDL